MVERFLVLLIFAMHVHVHVLGIPTQIIGIQGNENLFQSRPLGKVGINYQNLWVKSVGNYSYVKIYM